MTNNNTHYFHFTLGPVQGFVAQARRTRDFWAGSFILSWLAAVAIQAVRHQGGTVEFPKPDENYMNWLVGKGKKGKEPTQGSIPNRFKGLVAEVNPNTFNPHAVVKSVQEAWKALAEEVWKADLEHVKTKDGKNDIQRNIWNRQINNFWDMSWIITENETDTSALDKRKNWRTYTPPEEAGVKCMMMDGWQELSGEQRPNREKMNIFWDTVRENGRNGMKSDLRENEALCAIAFVKRRFSRHFHKLDHTMSRYPLLKDGELVKDKNNKLVESDGWQLKGWKVPTAVPSVVYMAAVHWLEQLLEKADANKLEDFYQSAYTLTGEYGEWATNIKCLDQAWGNREWKALDGNVFFRTTLENLNIFKDQTLANTVLEKLNSVRNSADLPEPTPFYAILLMDGDSLGMHMSNPDMHYSITQGLADFTNGVPAIVQDNNGFLIYAGGDDVLAILPLEDAITCAAKLRTHYLDCFKEQPNDDLKKYRHHIPTTLSGAIEFTHIHMPLTSILKDAHNLLDDIAKDGSGRDALAIRVWKRGGLQLEWSQPWRIAVNAETGKTYLEEMAECFQKANKDDNQFSNKFFYKIRERFDLLNPDITKKQEHILNDDDARSLMAMEYLNSGKSDLNTLKNAKERIEQARAIVTPLLTQCRPVKRILKDNKELLIEEWTRSKRLEADGALLVRFLAQKGVE